MRKAIKYNNTDGTKKNDTIVIEMTVSDFEENYCPGHFGEERDFICVGIRKKDPRFTCFRCQKEFYEDLGKGAANNG